MKRRFFLGSALASLVAACTPEVRQPLATDDGGSPLPTTADSPRSTVAAPAEKTPPPSQEVDPLDTEPVEFTSAPFTLGVASGDPTSSSVILWTRLTGELPEMVPLVWEVAFDEGFETLVATDRVSTASSLGHAVRVDVTGLGASGSFFYRFRAGTEVSPTGRTKTFAPPGERTSSLRLALSSCQAREDGAWAAHSSIAGADVDAVVWLGDYIYGQASTVAEYRESYARYRGDLALQAAHAAHPWIMIWDDHEVENDFNSGIDPNRLQAGLQAWRENQPVRVPEANTNGLVGYRSFTVGDLCQILMLDTRQYSTAGTTAAGDQVPQQTSVLGSSQMDWLVSQLDPTREDDSTGATAWSVVASPVLASGLQTPTSDDGPLLPYTWDGAPEDRRRLSASLANQDAVIVSGDLHSAMVLEFQADPTDASSPTTAPEFMAPSISSNFPARFEAAAPFLTLFNPQLEFINTSNGWLLLDITHERIRATFQFVSDPDDPKSDVVPGPTYEVIPGQASPRLL